MSLQVWLPLVSDKIENQGLADLTFTNTSPSIIKVNNSGKIGKCWERTDSSGNYVYSNEKINLTTTQSMFCWINFSSLNSGASLTGICGTHRYSSNSGMGITIKYITASTGKLSCNTGNGSSRTYNTYCGNTTLNANTWYHVGFTYDGSTIRFYVNGVFDGSHSYSNQKVLEDNVILYNWAFNSNTSIANFTSPYKLNDVRMYDHCLSLSEIKDISRGLVAHYPLKDPYIESTTNLATTQNYDIRNKSIWGGHTYWSERLSSIGTPCPSSQIDHFILEYKGSEGGGGSVYNKQYTIKPSTTYCYSLYVKASDDMEYIHGNFLYRYEYKDGTYVTESGIATRAKRIPLGNGWYRIWNTFTSNASSNKVTLCFYTYPCKNVEYWLACPQLEEKDHLTPYVLGSRNELNIYDVSGNSYNGLLSKNTALVKKDSPRYDKSTFLAGFSNPYIDFSLVVDNSALSNCTITYWARHKSSTTLLFTGQDTSHYVMASANNAWYHANCGSPVVYRNGVKGSYKAEANTWYFYVVKNVNLSAWTKLYLNKYSSSWPFNSDISDLRIYATALSDEDILKLYQSPTKISKNGVLITNGEFVEC